MDATNHVTLFMPTYNSAKYLVEAIESVLSQTYVNFDLLILDGGSRDLTESICRYYESKDSRVKFKVLNGTNPVERFNIAVKSSESEFLSIIHSDDIQHPDRIRLQVNHLRKSPGTAMTGTGTLFWLHGFDSNKPSTYSGVAHYPQSYEDIKAQLLFWWCFANPSLTFRLLHLKELNMLLPEDYRFSGDYLLYWQLAKKIKIDNMPDVLLSYRHHEQSEGPLNRKELEIESMRIRTEILRTSGLANFLDKKMQSVFLNLKIERNIIITCPDNVIDYKTLFDGIIVFASQTGEFSVDSVTGCTQAYLKQIENIKRKPKGVLVVLRLMKKVIMKYLCVKK